MSGHCVGMESLCQVCPGRIVGGGGSWLTMYRGKECRAWKIKVMAASRKCLGICGAEI